jgi:hypothetical protein
MWGRKRAFRLQAATQCSACGNQPCRSQHRQRDTHERQHQNQPWQELTGFGELIEKAIDGKHIPTS